MAEGKVYEFTKNGLEEAKAKLETLKTKTRKEVSEKIKEARSFGDLSENAEYDEAKNEQAEVEAEIMKLEDMIKNAVIVDADDSKKDVVTPGSKVTIHDVEMDEDIVYTIVGSMESDLMAGKLSYESPVGAALLKKKVGKTVEVMTTVEIAAFKLLKKER